jgi:methyltransferase-like protein
VATLFGMQPAPVDRCRVLELGCGDGSNLIPMAVGLPHSTFVGIDLAARPIVNGQDTVRTLGLTNIRLQRLDIAEIGGEFGVFDYIIAHGLYSWVPAAARERILAICPTHLAPNGVAFVSYNSLPGGHIRNLVREMMLFRAGPIGDPQQKLGEALEVVRLIAEAKPESDTYRTLMAKELDRLRSLRPENFFHDDLAAVNDSIYFHEFVTRAAGHGLQFLAEADLFEMQLSGFSVPVADAVRRFADGDRIAHEQYLDFLKGRRFRQTLLCHARIRLDPEPRVSRLGAFHAASSVRPTTAEPDLRSDAVVQFADGKGGLLSASHPVAKAALLHLGEIWPRAVRFDALLAEVQRCTGEAPSQDEATELAEMLLQMYATKLAELHVHRPDLPSDSSERPVASALARLQVQSGNRVTNQRHQTIELADARIRELVQLLDGTRDRAALCAALDVSAAELEQVLVKLAHFALLVA